MVRGKFKLTTVTSNSGYPGQEYKFTAVSDSGIAENAKFAKATPSGALTMMVDSPPAQSQLDLGEYYYLDLTPCPEVVNGIEYSK